MDDSDRSRDDDSAAADGSTGEDAPDSDGAVDAGSESDESADAEFEGVEPEVEPEVESEVGADSAGGESDAEPDATDGDDADTDADGVDSDGDADVESDGDADVDPDGDSADALDDPEAVVEAEDANRSEALADAADAEGSDADSDGDDADSESDGAPGSTVSADAGFDPDAAAAGDGGTPASAADAPTANAPAAVDDDEPFGGIEGPETDEEMPLAEHIEEMMRRLAVVFLIGGLATLVVITESTELINYFWSYHIPAPMENRPRLYGPLELPLTRLKVAGLAGVVVGLPAFVYETYRFMRPGLYQTERRYYLAAVPTSLVLGGIGIAFAHFLVLPAIFSYFTTYTSDAATIAFGLAETFNLIVIMLAFMAIVFQIPLFIMLAIMMNLVTREWLEAKRLIFWGSFLGIAFLFSPDPTGMAPIIVTLTMIALFEGTLAILRWTGN
jgi:sec-independent protein translocase protein TatC